MATRYSPRMVTDGLVLCLDAANSRSYPGAGSTWFDLSGNGNNATLYNTTYSSVNSGVIVFAGASNSKAHISSLTPNITSTYTITEWVKRDNTSYEFLWEGNTSGSKPSIEGNSFYHNNTNRGSLTVSTTEWTYVVAMFDGARTKAYINGVEVIDSAYTTANPTVTSFTIGARDSTSSLDLNGLIAAVCIYDRALTVAEVTQNFRAVKGRFGL